MDEFLTRDEVLEKLNIAPETLDRLITDYMIIGCRLSYGEIVYPAIFISPEGLIRAPLSILCQNFQNTIYDGWQIYQWMTTTQEDLGITPISYLAENGFDDKLKLVMELTKLQLTPNIKASDLIW